MGTEIDGAPGGAAKVDRRRATIEPGFEPKGAYARDGASRRTLARVADKWTILIVGRLSQRPCRFGQLRRSIEGISSKVLTEHLRALEAEGLIAWRIEPTSPPSAVYGLTEAGRSLAAAAAAMREWAERHAGDVAGPTASG